MGSLKFSDCNEPAIKSVLNGEYDIDLTQEPKTVLDIGAHQGAFTAWARRKWPHALITAFEPIPENAAIFRDNHRSDSAVSFINRAVSVDPVVTMRYGAANSGCSSRHDLGEQNGRTISVAASSPKEIGRAQFVKVDTEGCEVEIISNLDLSDTMALACEIHRDEDRQKVCSICDASGLVLISEKEIGNERWIQKYRRPSAYKKRTVFLAIPAYRYVEVFTVQSLMSLTANQLTKGDFGLKIKMHVGECPIGRARNDLTHEFLESDCTDILFVDSDISFNYEQVKKILEDEGDIVGGCYLKKQEGAPSVVFNTLGGNAVPNEKGLMEIKYAGTGFLRISRRVFEVMKQKMGKELQYIDDRDQKTVKYDFWRMGVSLDPQVGFNRWLSEDWQFCQFARDCGFKVFLDASILLNHSGIAVYPLSYQLEQLYTPEQRKLMKLSVTPDETGADTAGAVACSPTSTAPA